LLHTLDSSLVKERREIGIRQLYLLTVDRGGPTVGRVLWFGRGRVAKGEQCFGDVAGHGDVDVPRCIVPVDGEAEVAGASPVLGDGVLGGEGIKEVVGVGFGEEFDSEVVNGEGEGRGTVVVPPETRGVADWVVAEWCQMGTKLVVRKDGGLLEAVHAFSNLEVAITIRVKKFRREAVLLNDFVR